MRALNILQANLNRSRAAHDLALANIMEDQIDFLIAAEPNRDLTKTGWIRDKDANVAVKIGHVIEIKNTKDGHSIVQINTSTMTVIGAYFSPNEKITALQKHLTDLTEMLKSSSTDTVVVGDFNAKSAAWGSSVEDNRGREVNAWASAHNLIVMNDGDIPTCVRTNGTSYVDITFATASMARNIKEWRIKEDETLSDHRYISFKVRTQEKKLHGQEKRVVYTDKTRCEQKIKQLLDSGNIEENPEGCRKLLQAAQESAGVKEGRNRNTRL